MPTEGQVLVRLIGDVSDAQAKIEQLEARLDKFQSKARSSSKTMQDSTNTQFSRFSAESMAAMNNFKNKSTGAWSRFKSKGSNAMSTIKSKMGGLSNKLQGLNSTIGMMFGGLALGGIAKFTVGAAAENQQMKGLLQSTMRNKQEAANLNQQIKNVTKGSMVMPNQLAKAMGVLKMSTGINNKEMAKAVPLVKEMGQNLSLQGFAGKQLEEHLTSTLDGLQGNWRRLENNLGINEDQMKKAGWSGKKDDVEGYMQAMNKLLKQKANLDGAMDNTQGRWVQLQNQFQLVAMDIGELLLPAIDSLLKFFLSLSPGIQKNIIAIALLAGTIIAAIPFVVMIGNSFMKFARGIVSVGKAITGLPNTIRNVANSFSKLKEVSSSALSSLRSTASSAYTSLKASAISAYTTMKASAISAYTSLKASAISAYTTMKASAISAFTTMKTYAITAFTTIKAGAVTAFNAIKTGFAQMTAFMLANPILLVVAGIVLFIVALEKLGEYMGWWNGWGGMIESFKASLINAGQQIYGFLVGIGQAIMGVFNFLKGILVAYIGFVVWFWSSLIQLVVGFFMRIIGGVIAFGQKLLAAFKSGGISKVAQTVWNEFKKIPEKIRASVSSAVQAASNFGQSIKNAVFSALHINSPGIIQRTVQWEFAMIPGRISESMPNAEQVAQQYGAKIVHGFDASNVPQATSNLAAPVPAQQESSRVINIGSVNVDAKDRTLYDVSQELIGVLENIK